MIKQVQVVVENEFVTSDKNNINPNNTVFERVFRKLTHEKSDIGKIFPLYLKISDVYYTLGIFTLNRLGSTSLFLELPKGTFFDHITFGKNLINIKAHLTYISKNDRKKVTVLKPNLLSNGTYHVLTLIINDVSLLKLAPKKVIYPSVDVEHSKLLYEALITGGGFNGSGTLDTVGMSGLIVVQIFLIPNGIDFSVLTFTKSVLGPIAEKFKEKELKNIQVYKAHLGHEFQNEYQLGLLTFRYSAKIDDPLYLGFSVDKSSFYFNSPDMDLNKSVLNSTRNASKKLWQRK